MSRCRSAVACVLLALGLPAPAQDVASGPARDDKVPALKVHDCTGAHKGEDVDYAARRGEKPTVYLFVAADKFDRPMNRFMKALDAEVKKDFPDAYVVAVWLTEDEDRTRELLPRVQRSDGYEATVLACRRGAGPGGWNVNPDAHLTAVVANKGKVAWVGGYLSLNETDVPAVREALAKASKAR
jgi:hypothetical protein